MQFRSLSVLILFLGMFLSAGERQPQKTGIAVHGHWKLTILNADKSLHTEIEFDNALVNPAALTTLIMDDAVSGGIYLTVTNQSATSSGTGPCNPDCDIAPTGMNIGFTPDSTNLTTTQTGTNFETLRLAGDFTVTNTSTIDLVQSWILLCNGATNTAAQCRANPDSSSVFTSKILASGVAVTAGQIVQVTVDITFS